MISYAAIGDVMLDPFPFGGGVTTLEALSTCTPVITLPSRQTVPQLAAGMIDTMLGFNGKVMSLNGDIEGFNREYERESVKNSSGEFIFKENNEQIIMRKTMIVDNLQQYITTALSLLTTSNRSRRRRRSVEKYMNLMNQSYITSSFQPSLPSIKNIRKHICDHADKLYSQDNSVKDWETFFISASSYIV